MIGKWHLGFYNWDSTPTYRGFDTFYGFYSGAEDHYTHVQDHYLDLRDNEEIVRDLNGTYSVNAFAKVIVKAKWLNWESVHTCCPSGVPEVQYSLWALMWTRCFLRMILHRIHAWWMCYYVFDCCDIMFQSGRRNGANVYTDIYTLRSQFSVNAWPYVTICSWWGWAHITYTRMCCPTAGFGSRRGFSHLGY